MRIIVKAKVNAKKECVERMTDGTQSLLDDLRKDDIYKVSVKEPAVDGKANRAIIRAVANHFDVAPTLVTIVSGLTAKTKIIEIHA